MRAGQPVGYLELPKNRAQCYSIIILCDHHTAMQVPAVRQRRTGFKGRERESLKFPEENKAIVALRQAS